MYKTCFDCQRAKIIMYQGLKYVKCPLLSDVMCRHVPYWTLDCFTDFPDLPLFKEFKK